MMTNRLKAAMAALPLAVALAAPVGSARADAFFDNIGAVPSGSDPLESASPADSFTTGATVLPLTEIAALLTLNGPPNGLDNVFAVLLDDFGFGGGPGNVLATYSGVPESAITANTPVEFGVFGSLAPNTRYWIEIVGTDNVSWERSSDTSGPGVASEFYANSSGVFPNAGNSPYLMSIAAGAVPEPSSLALCGLGLAGVARYARRRRMAGA